MTRSTARTTALSVAVTLVALSLVGSAAFAAGQVTGKDIKDKTLGPGDLLDRVAYKTNDNDTLRGITGTQPALRVTITAPTKGYLVVTASSDNYSVGIPAIAACAIDLDGHYVLGSRRSIQLDQAQDNGEENCQTEVTVPVSAGKHVVRLMAFASDTDVVFDETTLSADFERFNGTGGAPTKAEITAAVQQPTKGGAGRNH